jgi:putative oxygen-independent coproporphyrinogen III oxidase
MSFGLYVHWPWCESKCPYCDFNSHVGNQISSARWIAAYKSEILRWRELSEQQVLGSIFIGGGTPSLMPPEIVSEIIGTATSAWRCTNDLEITMEGNPGSVDAARFHAYRQTGVNRLSLGIQALDNDDLRRLGRKHSVEEAERAINIAMRTFDRVSLDLMYGRQNQTESAWHAELTRAIDFGTEHLSLYQLTIEDGTVFARRHALGQLPGLPDEDRSVALYNITQELTERAGLVAYEVSNHARSSAECRHNLNYWRCGSWIGIGPGAHGRMNLGGRRLATESIRDPALWLDTVENLGSGDLESIVLDQLETVSEVLLMGLRLTEGLDTQRLRSNGVVLEHWSTLHSLIEDGLLKKDRSLRTTTTGRMLLNTVLQRLCSDIPLITNDHPR